MNFKTQKIDVIFCVKEVDQKVINSIRTLNNQTFDDFGIILVFKNGLVDTVSQKIRSILTNEHQLTIVQQTSGKLSDARNIGLDNLSAPYFTFIDGDDTVEPNHLNNLISHMDSAVDQIISLPILTGGMQNRMWGWFNKRSPGDYKPTKRLLQDLPVVVWGKLFRTDVVQNWKIRFPHNVIFEDNYFHWAYSTLCRRIRIISERSYHYEISSSSLMGTVSSANGAKGLDNLVVLSAIIETLTNNSREVFIDRRLLRMYYMAALNFSEPKYVPEINYRFNNILKRIPTYTANLTILSLAYKGRPKNFDKCEFIRMVFLSFYTRLIFNQEK